MPLAVSRLAVFDLDGTLTWSDSFRGFLGGYLRRRPARCLRAWRLPRRCSHPRLPYTGAP